MPMELVVYPSDYLVAHNQKIDVYTPDIKARVSQMWEVMEKSDGVGLAAPQVGWNVQLFILGVPDRSGEMIHRVVWNPRVETFGDQVPMFEGCLSFPGIRAQIKRWTHARLVGMTPEGPLDETLFGLAAQAAQHEADHLDGLLFIERMTSADRQKAEPILRALAEGTLKKKPTA
jgi:peptide deformylase